MELSTERLILKEIGWGDSEDIHRLHSFAEVDEFNTLGIPASLEVTRETIVKPAIEAQSAAERRSYEWKIVRKDGEAIGMAGMFLSADNTGRARYITSSFLPSGGRDTQRRR